jgi:MFS transporter, DHA2 family, multidrug resistance protein
MSVGVVASLPLGVPFPVDLRRRVVQQHVLVDMTPSPLSGLRRVWVLVGALAAIFIDQSASTIASSTLSSIQGAFALGPDQGSWFLTIYNAAYYAAILSSIWMIARVGRKRALVGSLLAYAVLSLLCIVAPNAFVLLVLRFLQGVAEGGMFTAATLVMFNVHKPPEIPKAFFAFSVVSLAGGALGPLAGGSLIQYAHWEDAFAISALVSIVAAVLIIVNLPRDPGRHQSNPYDAIGFALAVAMFVPFQYLVNEGERRDWFNDPNVVLAAIAFPILLGALVVWMRFFAPHPVLDLRVFSLRNVAPGIMIALLFALGGYSTTEMIAFAQSDGGFSPTIASWLVGMRVIAIAVAVPAIGLLVLAQRIAARTALAVGGTLYLVLMGAMSVLLNGESDLDSLIPLTLAIGVLQGISNQPLPGQVLGGLPPGQMPIVLAFYKLAPLIGTSIGNAFCQRMLDVADANHLSELAGDVTLSQAGVTTVAQSSAAEQIGSIVSQQAMVLSYADVTLWVALLGLLAIPFVALIRPAVRRS